MSLILDALRRAESGRTRDLGQRIAQPLPPHARRQRRGLRARWFVGALLVAAGAVVVAVMSPVTERIPEGVPPLPHTVERAPPLAALPAPTADARLPEARAARPGPPARGSSLAEIAVPTPADTPAPLLLQLPDEVRRTVPALTVDAHFWSADPARRFIVLDMTRFREGDAVRDGLRVVRIDADGAVLDWRGTRFRVLADAR